MDNQQFDALDQFDAITPEELEKMLRDNANSADEPDGETILLEELSATIPDAITEQGSEAVAEYHKNRTDRYTRGTETALENAKGNVTALKYIQKSLPKSRVRTSLTNLIEVAAPVFDNFTIATEETEIIKQFVGTVNTNRNLAPLISGFVAIKKLSDKTDQVNPQKLEELSTVMNTHRELYRMTGLFTSMQVVDSDTFSAPYLTEQPDWSNAITKAVDGVIGSISEVSRLKTADRIIEKLIDGLKQAMTTDKDGKTVFLDNPDLITISERSISPVMISPVDTVTTKLLSRKTNIGLEAKPQFVEILPKAKNRTAVSAKVMFTCSDAKGLKTSAKISQYDSLVYDAVCTLYETGNDDHTLTTEMILETMSGKKLSGGISPAQAEQIDNVMCKLSAIRGKIDFSDVAQRKKLKDEKGNDVVELKYGSALLEFDDYTLKTTGDKGTRTSTKYRIKEEPLLLKNAHVLNQIATIPRDWYNIREIDEYGQIIDVSIPDTKDRASVKQYIIKNVKMIQNKVKNDRKRKEPKGLTGGKLKYDTIFSECDFDVPSGGRTKSMSSKKRIRMKEYIKAVFDYLKALGVIESWSEYSTTGRKKDGISYQIK